MALSVFFFIRYRCKQILSFLSRISWFRIVVAFPLMYIDYFNVPDLLAELFAVVMDLFSSFLRIISLSFLINLNCNESVLVEKVYHSLCQTSSREE